jgi:sarcosine oxidase subunit alpha
VGGDRRARPKSRDIITPLVEGIGMSDEALPHMSVREGKICGVPTRLFRMSFSGERGSRSTCRLTVARRSGKRSGRRPETWCCRLAPRRCVLRAKGYIIVGEDTDGTVTPNDAGLDRPVGKERPISSVFAAWRGRIWSPRAASSLSA